MRTGCHIVLVAVLAVALMITMIALPAFAVEGGTPNPAEALPSAQVDQGSLKIGTLSTADANSQVKRTIMLYDCGADLETDAGLATYNLNQILRSNFSSDDDITFLVMTGGSHK